MATKKRRKKVSRAAPAEAAASAAELKMVMEAFASLSPGQQRCLKAFDRLAAAGERATRRAVAKELELSESAAQAPTKELRKKGFLEPITEPQIVRHELTDLAKACLKFIR